jgi:hypothetical protein
LVRHRHAKSPSPLAIETVTFATFVYPATLLVLNLAVAVMLIERRLATA